MCPDREILSAYFDGEIGSPWERAIAEHVASCEHCREMLWAPGEDPQHPAARTPPWNGGSRWRGSAAASRTRPRPTGRRLPVWRRAVSLPAAGGRAGGGAAPHFRRDPGRPCHAHEHGVHPGHQGARPGGTEYQFAVPYDKVEALLKSVGGADASIEIVMTIPKNVKLIPVGEPRMGKASGVPEEEAMTNRDAQR